MYCTIKTGYIGFIASIHESIWLLKFLNSQAIMFKMYKNIHSFLTNLNLKRFVQLFKVKASLNLFLYWQIP